MLNSFSFIGLTPGLLVAYASVRWVASLFDSRRGFRAGMEKQQFRRALRYVSELPTLFGLSDYVLKSCFLVYSNIDRILMAYSSTPSSILSYRDYGLCIYEANILKQRARYTLPRSVLPMFQQDLTDLTDMGHGVSRQQSVVHRIQWMYSKWI
jgi:nuclear control of ATPase protein 2